MAGAQQRYIDPSHPDWASRTSVDDIPMGAQYKPYRCPAEDVTDSQIFWEVARPSLTLTASNSSRIERAASYAFAGRPAALPRESQLTLSWGT